MKKILLFTAFLVLSIVGSVIVAQGKNPVVGNWNYEVSQAPYGYDKGKISLSMEKEVLKGDVSFQSGYSVVLQNVTLKNDTLRAKVFIDGENVSITARINKNNMTGSVDSSMGRMALKAQKIVATDKK